MTYTLRLLPEVEEDVIGGYAWYESKSPGLGEEFLRMFFACVGEILKNPLLYQKVHSEFRIEKNRKNANRSFLRAAKRRA